MISIFFLAAPGVIGWAGLEVSVAGMQWSLTLGSGVVTEPDGAFLAG